MVSHQLIVMMKNKIFIILINSSKIFILINNSSKTMMKRFNQRLIMLMLKKLLNKLRKIKIIILTSVVLDKVRIMKIYRIKWKIKPLNNRIMIFLIKNREKIKLKMYLYKRI